VEKNMSIIQPRTLSNDELVRLSANYVAEENAGLPLSFQIELLRRFTVLLSPNAPVEKDPRQLELFK
jgi:hypothetical protein